MTRKDYNAMAERLANYLAEGNAEKNQVQGVARLVADFFAADNYAFDYGRFYKRVAQLLKEEHECDGIANHLLKETGWL